MRADLADVEAKIDRLAEAQRRSLAETLESLTEAELQALADEHGIPGVDQAGQTRDEMVAVIRRALTG